MAATRRDEGQRKCCLDNVRIWSSGPTAKSGGFVKNRHSGAPEGAPAANTAGGRLPRGALVIDAPDRRSAPSWERGRREGAGPAPMTQRADETRLHDRDVTR